jgi:hypothetical protein
MRGHDVDAIFNHCLDIAEQIEHIVGIDNVYQGLFGMD